MKNLNKKEEMQFLYLVIFCICIFVISRCVFFLEYSFIVNNIINTNKSLLENIWRWDSIHYADIALHGYEKVYQLGGNFVWLPLWPLILKVFSLNGYLNIQLTGIFLNQILLCITLVLLGRYFLYKGISKSNVEYAIVLLSFSPVNIYFFAGLTEVTFLFLTVLSFYLLEKNKIWTCVIISSLLSALKIVGLAFAVAFLYNQYKNRKLTLITLVQIVIMSAPLLSYMLYLQIHVGDFLAFLHAQKAPGFARPGFDFTENYITQIISMYNRATVYDFSAFIISLFLITGVLWYRRLNKELIFNLACIILIFISGGLWNSFRMTFCLFTAYLAPTVLSKDLSTSKLIILIISTIMTIICMIYWLSGSWFFA